MRKSLALMIFFSSFIGLALNASFKDYAIERQKQVKNTTKTTSPHTVPGFQTASPPETSLDNASALKDATESVFNNNENAKALKRTAENRPYFLIDLDKDPLVKNSAESVQNPEKVLKSDLSNRNQGITYVIKTCRESKPAIEFQCSKNLIPPTMHIDPAKYSHFWCSAGNHQPDDPVCSAKTYYPIARMYAPENVQTSPEVWTSDCGGMETETKKRACKLIKQVCPKGPETRTVIATVGPNRTPTPRQITRNCWRYELIYACAYSSPNTCEALRKSTCE